MPEKDIKFIESALIERYQPSANSMMPGVDEKQIHASALFSEINRELKAHIKEMQGEFGI